jgi:hypothetical protein
MKKPCNRIAYIHNLFVSTITTTINPVGGETIKHLSLKTAEYYEDSDGFSYNQKLNARANSLDVAYLERVSPLNLILSLEFSDQTTKIWGEKENPVIASFKNNNGVYELEFTRTSLTSLIL